MDNDDTAIGLSLRYQWLTGWRASELDPAFGQGLAFGGLW